MSFSCRPSSKKSSALLYSMAAHGWVPRGLTKLAENEISIPIPGRLARLKQFFTQLIGLGGKKPKAEEKPEKEADIIKESE